MSSRIPTIEVETATGKHAEFLGKLKPHLNIYRMLANSEAGLKGFVRMGNCAALPLRARCGLRELAIMRVGRLSRAAYEVFQHERIAPRGGRRRRQDRRPARGHHRGAGLQRQREGGAALHRRRGAQRQGVGQEPQGRAAFLTPGAMVELTLTVGYYMMVCRFLETTGVEGEDGQAEWLKTAKL
jgi:hypothetical protein